MQITLEVPDSVGEKLQQLGDRLPEVLERAVSELLPSETAPYRNELEILELLVSQPSPETILALRPTPDLQARMSELLAATKSGNLSRTEEAERDRYLLLEHWVRLAKVRAIEQLQISPNPVGA